MMNVLLNFSNIIIPALIFYIVGYGLVNKINVYEEFLSGAKEGVGIVIKIMPTLIGLMMAVGILRASGFLEFLGGLLKVPADAVGFPSELVPLVFIKMVSSSAATGLVLDIFKTYGPDSDTGFITSIMMSCTETIFYTMSVYFLAAKVSRTRWTLSGALLSTFAGIAASVFLGRLM